MRIISLQIATLLILLGCTQDQNRFDVKSREFNQKSSHHYSEKFDNNGTTQKENDNSDVIQVESNNPIKGNENINEPISDNPSDNKGLISRFFNIFSSSDEKIDSLDKVINDCEERLYTHADEASSQQSAINSLIGERNYLLMQLDSLQTAIAKSKNTSSQRVVQLERDHKKLKSLIKLLSSEIE